MNDIQAHERGLRILGFAPLADTDRLTYPVLCILFARIGEEPSRFIRTDALGLGYTLARACDGTLWWNQGQYDLRRLRHYKELPALVTRG